MITISQHNLIFYWTFYLMSNIRMGNYIKFAAFCCNDSTSGSEKSANAQALCGPDGKVIGVEGLHVDFKVKQVYNSRLIQIEFISNLSGKPYTLYKCVHISNLPLSAKTREIEEAFKQSTKNVLHISADQTYFYEGKVTVTVNDVSYDFSEYLLLRSFARFQTISRPVSPTGTERKESSGAESPIMVHFPRRINLSRDIGKSEAEEFVQGSHRTVVVSGIPITSTNVETLDLTAPANSPTIAASKIAVDVNSPKMSEHAGKLIEKLEIIENKFT